MRRLTGFGVCIPMMLSILLGCQSPQEEFASGRLQKFCEGSIPICSVHAACVVSNQDFLEAEFPGGQRFIVEADDLDRTAVIRLYFNEMVFPGTEFQIKLYGPGCGTLETTHLVDVDLFERAGDDSTVEFTLPIDVPGDHLLEIYSDMAAGYLLTADLIR